MKPIWLALVLIALLAMPGRLHAEVVCNAGRLLTEALRKNND